MQFGFMLAGFFSPLGCVGEANCKEFLRASPRRFETDIFGRGFSFSSLIICSCAPIWQCFCNQLQELELAASFCILTTFAKLRRSF